ncbi:division abnormally delayed protein [Harmonia axyridis]|uniref:division abnormally delayed protein n=1 Tax=Harmonia axyridis TaxID=115357 RepID=UPI001E275A27|nr:division abnormally delayed protein [Harmonia axyridis]
MSARVNVVFVAYLVLVCFSSVVYSKNVNARLAKRTTDNGLGDESCDNVKPFFEMKNVTVTLDSPKGNICSGHCCDEKAESQLKRMAQKDFASLLQHNSRSLQGSLSSTSETLQNHMQQLTQQSENKTLLLFANVYRRMSVYSKAPIESFYSDIRKALMVNITNGEIILPNLDIQNSAATFFTDLFPLVYLHTLSNTETLKDFSLDYKSCLKESTKDILPFGDIPKQIAQTLAKSLDATQILFQAFAVGLEVLNVTDVVLVNENGRNNGQCHDALVKLTYCPRCLGLVKDVKPCSGYCLNVLRGCLTSYVAELDSPWNSYVESIEKLVNAMKHHNNEVGVNADGIIRELDNRISEAIMHAMTKGQEIDSKAKKFCGLPKFSEKEDPLTTETSTQATPGSQIGGAKLRFAPTRASAFLPPPETQLLQFLTSISKTKGFYGNLADTLCQDESFAEPNDRRCWNGERIAEYTKTVVDASQDMQKYNPEVKPNPNPQNGDKRIADLADKLRHIHNIVLATLGSTFSNEFDSMQRDSGADGSGSGSGPDMEEDDDEYSRGSGSGDGPGVVEGGGTPHSTAGGQPSNGKAKNNPASPDVKVHHNSDKSPTHSTPIPRPSSSNPTCSISSILVALSALALFHQNDVARII